MKAAAALAGVICLMLLVAFRHNVRQAFGLPTSESVIKRLLFRKKLDVGALPARRLVLFVTGQSNAGNHGKGREGPVNGVWELSDGRLLAARDPLLGSDGLGASPWIRMGRMIVESDAADAVVLIVVAQGGTPISEWGAAGPMRARSMAALRDAAKFGLEISAVFWHQGESDCAPFRATSEQQYREALRDFVGALRSVGVRAPVYVAMATRHHNAVSEQIRAAQKGVVDIGSGIMPGPDFDSLGPEWRHDGVHFSSAGLDRVARMWFNTLGALR